MKCRNIYSKEKSRPEKRRYWDRKKTQGREREGLWIPWFEHGNLNAFPAGVWYEHTDISTFYFMSKEGFRNNIGIIPKQQAHKT